MNKFGLTNEEYAFISKIPFESEEERLAFIKSHIINKRDFDDVLNSESFMKAIESSLIKKEENIINNKEIYMQEQTKKNENANCNDKLPNRADEKYTRIENYENYEFTHCIAYEMAIRNEEVKKLTVALEKLNSLSFDICSNFNSELSIKNKDINLGNLINKMMSLSNTLNVNNLQETISEIYHNLSNNLDTNHIQTIKKRFIQIIDENEKDYFISIMKNYQNSNIEPLLLKYQENDLEELFKKAISGDKLFLIDLLKNSIQDKLAYEYYVVNEKKSITPEHIEEFISKDTNYEPNPEINNHINIIFNEPNYKENYIHEKGYTSYQGAYMEDSGFKINEVIPNFSQPLRMFNTMKISINPSLPLNDILSFVKRIKEDYDNRNSFKSFFELLEEDLDISTETTKSTIDDPLTFSKDKWTDMFYIYDYFQFYLSNKDKINKSKTIKEKYNKEDDKTIIAKEIFLQLSYYHILKHKTALDFTGSFGNYKSAYDWYHGDFPVKIQGVLENNENSNLVNYLKLPRKEEKEIEEKIISEIKVEKKSKKLESITKKEQNDRIKEAIRNEKLKRLKDTSALYYMTADHIKIDYYPKIRKLIEGEEPEYKRLIGGRNHEKNSFIDGRNNDSSRL